MYDYKLSFDTSKKVAEKVESGYKADFVDKIFMDVKNILDDVFYSPKTKSNIDYLKYNDQKPAIPLAFSKAELDKIDLENRQIDNDIAWVNFNKIIANKKGKVAVDSKNLDGLVEIGKRQQMYDSQLATDEKCRLRLEKFIRDKELDFMAQFAEVERQFKNTKEFREMLRNVDENVILGFKLSKVISYLLDNLDGKDEKTKNMVLSDSRVEALLGDNAKYVNRSFKNVGADSKSSD